MKQHVEEKPPAVDFLSAHEKSKKNSESELLYEMQYTTALTYIRRILDWKIVSEENVLVALLSHQFDDLAIEYMGNYSHFLDKELFIFCIINGNNVFL